MNRLHYILTFLMTALPIIAGGCVAAQGNKDIQNTDRLSHLQVGATTKEEVVKLFGAPTTTELRDSGSVQWTYAYVRTQERLLNYVPVLNYVPHGRETQTATLTLLFDSRGILRNMDSGGTVGGAGGIEDLGR